MLETQKLEDVYKELCSEPSDINEHLEVLAKYASECSHITEFWVRTWLSTIALLYGMKTWARLKSYDIKWTPEILIIDKIAKQAWKKRNFNETDVLKEEIEFTDLLFIDTWHVYDQLIQELTIHAPRVNKYIIMHDTVSYGDKWETYWYPVREWGYDWLNKAIMEFLLANDEWKVKERFTNNNWLTILEKVPYLVTKNSTNEIEDTEKWVVTIYTAIYWDYDVLKKQPEQTIPCRYICYTDWKLQIEKWAEKQWKVINDANRKHLHPRMRAKRFRTHPSELFKSGDIVMYIDWTARFQSNDTVEHFVKQMLSKSDILCFQHPQRDCIYDEADFCVKNSIEKYNWLPLRQQAQYYMDKWHPKHWWLSATWMLISKLWNEKTKEFLHKRWTECLERTYQDQISFDYLVKNLGIKRQRVQEDIRKNPYITFTSPHLYPWR